MVRLSGMSYGSTLGATVAAMFPDKIDKLILDGVQNPHEYYHAFAYEGPTHLSRGRMLTFSNPP
jgi:pimeloyl-ACP methyl ester carboxylesterase